jgi:hypothetical protein
LRDETELETLRVDVVSVVSEAMQPAHVSLWLRSSHRSEARREAIRMSTRAAPWLAWLLAALSMAIFLATVVLFVLTRSAHVPSSSSASRTVIDLLVSVPVLAFPIVGALIASRRPQNPIGWICLADGLLWVLLGLFDYYSVYGLARPGSVPFPRRWPG